MILATKSRRHGNVSRAIRTLVIAACALSMVAGQAVAQRPASVIDCAKLFAPVAEQSGGAFQKAAPGLELRVRADAYRQIRSDSHLELVNFPLPSGETADLALTEFSIFTEKSEFYSVSASGQVRRPLPDIRLYRGHVKDEPHSFVYIAVEPSGLSGTVIRAHTKYNILSGKDASMNIVGGLIRVYSVTEDQSDYDCAVDDAFVQNGFLDAVEPSKIESLTGLDTLEAVIAIEADFESFQHYGGETETENYIIARMGESSAIYQRDVAIMLSIGQMRVWTTKDPYPAKSANEGLNVFTQYWKENMSDVERTLAVYISRKPISGNGVSQGVAWVGRIVSDGNYSGVLCSEALGYAYVKFSGNDNFISGHVGVLAHEIGHNFGSPHTHSCYWNPPIDSCYTAEAMQGKSACFANNQRHLILGGGELMSYCHLGGYGANAKHNDIREKCGLHIRGRADAAICMSVVTGGGGGSGIVPSLTLLTPTGGEQLCAGQSLDIRWDAVGNNEINVWLSRNNGATYDTIIIAAIPRNERSVTWYPPNDFPVGSTYRIRIADGKNDELVDEMDRSFAILPGTVVTRFAPEFGVRYVCEGQGANFNLDAIGSGTLTYQWFRDGQPIAGQTTNNLQLENLTKDADNNTEYFCTVTGDCGSVNSDTALLRVFTAPVLVRKPADDTVCIGDTAHFDLLVDGPNLTYKWRALLSGKVYNNNLPYLSIPNIKQEDFGGYQCELQSSCGPLTVTSFFVILATPGAKFKQPFWNYVISSGSIYDVTWSQFCLGNLKLEYSSNGGTDWSVVAPSIPAEGLHYSWSVPTATTETAVLRLTDLADPSKVAESGTFAIRDMPELEVLPHEFGFSLVAIGETQPAVVTLKNNGRGPLEVTATTLENASKVTILNGPGAGVNISVPAGGSYDLQLEYAPTELELVEGRLLIDHNAADTLTVVTFRAESYVATSTPDIPVAAGLRLYQNFPNPVSLTSGVQPSISYDLPASTNVTLAVYNALGQEVARLAEGYKVQGRHTVTIDIEGYAAGTYMYKLTAGKTVLTNAMQVIR